MNIKKAIKHLLSEDNPFAIARRKKLQSGVVNRTATFLCPNCLGGILFHDLGLQFQSPTVNTMIFQNEFARFVLNMEHYLNQELVFFSAPEYSCPCAHLDDITIHFTHYKTEQESREKWHQRSQRINRDNMFVFLMERDGLTYDDMVQLGSIKARGLLIFTAHDYPDLPYTLPIEKYMKDGEVGNVLAKHYWNDSHEYEQYFDFVKWMNEADGGNYDISPYVK